MPTLICSPSIASSKQLHDILTHFGLKEGDPISASITVARSTLPRT